MMITLHPTYTFRVEVQDRAPVPHIAGAQTVAEAFGSQKFYDPFSGETGCDELLVAVRKALADAGLPPFTVSLEKFEHRA